jgi:hypothetical protein
MVPLRGYTDAGPLPDTSGAIPRAERASGSVRARGGTRPRTIHSADRPPREPASAPRPLGADARRGPSPAPRRSRTPRPDRSRSRGWPSASLPRSLLRRGRRPRQRRRFQRTRRGADAAVRRGPGRPERTAHRRDRLRPGGAVEVPGATPFRRCRSVAPFSAALARSADRPRRFRRGSELAGGPLPVSSFGRRDDGVVAEADGILRCRDHVRSTHLGPGTRPCDRRPERPGLLGPAPRSRRAPRTTSGPLVERGRHTGLRRAFRGRRRRSVSADEQD